MRKIRKTRLDGTKIPTYQDDPSNVFGSYNPTYNPTASPLDYYVPKSNRVYPGQSMNKSGETINWLIDEAEKQQDTIVAQQERIDTLESELDEWQEEVIILRERLQDINVWIKTIEGKRIIE